MKKDIHPDYKECTVTCACGNSFVTKTNVETLKIDICSACHPFFTGEQKIVDAAGRVEKFKARYAKK
jgi:large subunit ribosomal protein L31